MGGPGTGKTILCAQFIYNGAKQHGEGGVYVSMDETPHHFYQEMAKFGWDFRGLKLDGKFRFVDASPVGRAGSRTPGLSIGSRGFSIEKLVKVIRSEVEAINAQRIAIDPLTSLIFQYPDAVERRTAILRIVQALLEMGITSILTTELRYEGLQRSVQLEEYLAHGVIILQTMKVGRSFVRVLRVEKMRGTRINDQPKPYRITDRGIEVYPRESIL